VLSRGDGVYWIWQPADGTVTEILAEDPGGAEALDTEWGTRWRRTRAVDLAEVTAALDLLDDGVWTLPEGPVEGGVEGGGPTRPRPSTAHDLAVVVSLDDVHWKRLGPPPKGKAGSCQVETVFTAWGEPTTVRFLDCPTRLQAPTDAWILGTRIYPIKRDGEKVRVRLVQHLP
jgi:hypothetical protein